MIVLREALIADDLTNCFASSRTLYSVFLTPAADINQETRSTNSVVYV